MLPFRLVSWLRRPNRPAAPRRAAPALEQLEARNVPSVAPNAVYVGSLYQGLLGRNADANGLKYWMGQMNAGVSGTQAATAIAGSNEALGHDVQLIYDVLLGRPADADGLSYWTNQLASGTTLDQPKAGILGSSEFFTRAGGTTQGFLNALYSYELGRPVDLAGSNYWEMQLNSGVSRATVAGDVLATPEALREKVTSLFNDVLDRAPDGGGLNYWSAQLQADVAESQVLGGILGSNEYCALVQNTAAAPNELDPNQAASDMIRQFGLFTGPLPGAEYLADRPLSARAGIAPTAVPAPVASAPVDVYPVPTSILTSLTAPAGPRPTLSPSSVASTPAGVHPGPVVSVPPPAMTGTHTPPSAPPNASAPPATVPPATDDTADWGDDATQLLLEVQQEAALQLQQEEADQQAALQEQMDAAAQQAAWQQQQDDEAAAQQAALEQQQEAAAQQAAQEAAWEQQQAAAAQQAAWQQQQEADAAAQQAALEQQQQADAAAQQAAWQQQQADAAAAQQAAWQQQQDEAAQQAAWQQQLAAQQDT